MSTRRVFCSIVAAAAALAACSDAPSSPSDETLDAPALAAAPAPGGLSTVPVNGSALELWPFLSPDLDSAYDPLSLIVTGESDPRRIRAALLSLNGDRSGLPGPFAPLAAFDCTWADAIGDEQGTYVDGLGWTASSIQLECGPFGPAPRFHIRLFDAGDAVLVGAHFEIQVPGTTDHEVLNFDLGKALVAADLLRAGIVGMPAPTAAPIAALSRRIREPVYDALVNDPQIGPMIPFLTGGPDQATWNAADPKPEVIVPNDGHPLVAAAVQHFASLGTGSSNSFVVQLDQIIPKPFCAATEQLVHVSGPVYFEQEVTVQPNGRLMSDIRIDGEITVTPVLPAGEPYRARVAEMHRSWLTADAHSVHWTNKQTMLPARTADRGTHRLSFHVASGGPASFWVRDNCGGGADRAPGGMDPTGMGGPRGPRGPRMQ